MPQDRTQSLETSRRLAVGLAEASILGKMLRLEVLQAAMLVVQQFRAKAMLEALAVLVVAAGPVV